MCSDDFRRIVTPLFPLVSILKHGTLTEARAEIAKAFDNCLRPILRPNWRREWNQSEATNSQCFYHSHFPRAIERSHKERALILDLLTALWGFHEQPSSGYRELAEESLAACVKLTGHSAIELARDRQSKADTIKQKRSTQKGEAKTKIIAALANHHQYQGGSCLNSAYIGVNALARMAGVSRDSVNRFFNKQFGAGGKDGHTRYKRACGDSIKLVSSLKLLLGELTPSILSNPLPNVNEVVDSTGPRPPAKPLRKSNPADG